MQKLDLETFCPTCQQEWREWLLQHHQTRQSVWLVYYKKKANVPSITYSEAVDEALCFGWIDSTRKSIDQDTFMQFFCKRKPTSTWSKVNKDKIQRLIKAGLMTQAGYDSIETAKQNGSWETLDEVEALIIPEDLEKALAARPGATEYFLSLSRSTRKSILHWLIMAKRPETRQRRMDEIALLAGQKQKPKPFG